MEAYLVLLTQWSILAGFGCYSFVITSGARPSVEIDLSLGPDRPALSEVSATPLLCHDCTTSRFIVAGGAFVRQLGGSKPHAIDAIYWRLDNCNVTN